MISAEHRHTVRGLCASYGVSRQAFYQVKGREAKHMAVEQQVLELVRHRRRQLPFEGVRKLQQHLTPALQALGIQLGRDRFYRLLREQDMLVRRKRRRVVTTQSRHPFYIHKNLLEGFIPTAQHQLWVADITYLKTRHQFMYLALITDAYSRKIIGFDVSASLELTGCQRALNMALKQLPQGSYPIHHSDRGIQYCSHAYTGLLKSRGLKISMADKGNCYQNALAERVNGILKEEFLLDHIFATKQQAIVVTKTAIRAYNQIRLHLMLNFKTPDEVHKNPNY